MRSALRNGKITPPRSLRDANDRHRQLIHEIAHIQQQLDDPGRVLRYPSTAAYDTWAESARHALKLFHAEAKQIAEWVSARDSPETLLADAYAVLKVLAEETDLEPHEREVLNRLTLHFAARVDKKIA